MQGDGVEAAVLGEAREVDADDVVVVPAHAELDGEGDGDGGANRAEDALDGRQVAQQAGAAIAANDALGRAAEVQVDEIEAGVLDDARGVCEGGRIRPEQLRRYRVLVVVVGEVALALDLAHTGKTVGGGELRHDEAAAGLLVGGCGVDAGRVRKQPQVLRLGCASLRMTSLVSELAGVLDEAAEDGVGDAGHGGEHGGGRDADAADGEAGGHAAVLGHRVLGGRVPLLLLEGVALLHPVPVYR